MSEELIIDTKWADIDVLTITPQCEVLVSDKPVPMIADIETGITTKGKAGKARLGVVTKIEGSKIILLLYGNSPIPQRMRTVTSDHIVCITKTLADRKRFN